MVTRKSGLGAVAVLAPVAVALVVSACASTGNTLAQDLAWERWHRCRGIPGVELKEIRPDGQIWVLYTSHSGMRQWQDCNRQAAIEQGRRGGGAQRGTGVTGAQAPLPDRISPPTWHRGDEWAYRYEQPSGTGTFVWSVDRQESVAQ
jgi:hypothetical protein